ncbi:hypothetical protein ACFQ9Q_17715 [Streptomyces virginiae]|uniref:hypothetical protein n=1 Tax=Streptomyces TaxID=1883 RepID=UPI002DDA45AD|nr:MULTISPECIES: hypothetical protein [Streptomyces]WSC75466.1 hypothetical protein OHA56_03560 [Streptomyces virginiae]
MARERAPDSESLAAVTRLLPQTSYKPVPDTSHAAEAGPRGGRIDLLCLLPNSPPPT